MAGPKRKTTVRSIRIRATLQELLERDAEDKGISFNALVSAILARYAEWDRYTEKFRFVTITRNTFRALLNALDDADVVRVAREMGAQNPREMALFWFKKLDLETFLAYLSLIGRYGKTIDYEVERDDGDVTVLIEHELGPRYSTFLATFMEEAVRGIVGISPRCQTGRGSVLVKFSVP